MTDLLDLDSAVARLLAHLEPLPGTETRPLEDALGRVVATPVDAAVDVPPFANSAMDGYAVAHDDPQVIARAPLEIIDRSMAGRPASRALRPGTCIRIFTGAALPAGADAVIAQEDAQIIDATHVRLDEQATRGKFVRAVGGDIGRGTRLVEAGERLHGAHLGVLAATGNPTVTTYRQPAITVITTGDELRRPGDSLAPGQIHDTSRFTLPALLAPLPVRVLGVRHSPDDPEVLRATFDAAAEAGDVLLCAGGVSVGDADHVREILERDGEMMFWRLAVKPGKPFAFGHYRGRPLFGLPGNPVSSLVTFLLLVRPALMRLAGMTDPRLPQGTAVLDAPVRKTPGRRDFQRAAFVASHASASEALPRVRAFERQDSNVLSGVAAADCLLDLPAAAGDLPAGTQVRFIPLAGLLG